MIETDGPCCDGCYCAFCWMGWVTVPKRERAVRRIEQIMAEAVYNDLVRDEPRATTASHRDQIEEVLIWLEKQP